MIIDLRFVFDRSVTFQVFFHNKTKLTKFTMEYSVTQLLINYDRHILNLMVNKNKMKRLCPVCLEVKDLVKGIGKCANCVHNGYSRKISPENLLITQPNPTLQELKKKWERK